MKNYTIQFIDKKYYNKEDTEFILRYEINSEEENKIINIYYANGDVTSIPYTSYGEVLILEKMKNQLIRYDNIMKQVISELDIAEKVIKTSALLFKAVVIGGIMLMIKGGIPLKIIGCFIFAFNIFLVKSLYEYNREKHLTIEDYRKNKLFLENEELINEMINLKKELCTIYHLPVVKKDDKLLLTLNSIHQMSLSDLNSLLDYSKEKVFVK